MWSCVFSLSPSVSLRDTHSCPHTNTSEMVKAFSPRGALLMHSPALNNTLNRPHLRFQGNLHVSLLYQKNIFIQCNSLCVHLLLLFDVFNVLSLESPLPSKMYWLHASVSPHTHSLSRSLHFSLSKRSLLRFSLNTDALHRHPLGQTSSTSFERSSSPRRYSSRFLCLLPTVQLI